MAMDDAEGRATSMGSGFLIRQGIVATSLYLVHGSVKGSVRLVGTSNELEVAETVAADHERDLVLLSVPGLRGPWLSLADGSQVTVGDEVFVVENPRRLEVTFPHGIVSATRDAGLRTLMRRG